MRILQLTIFLLFLGLTNQAFAQNVGSASYANSSKKIEAQKFVGTSPLPFQASDMTGKNHFLLDYKGKVVILAFWSAADEVSREQIKSLNKLQSEFNRNEVALISLADEDKADLNSFLKHNQVNYPIIPNASQLGQVGYGSDLGMSRIYIVNKFGTVERVYISEDESGMQTYHDLKETVNELLNK